MGLYPTAERIVSDLEKAVELLPVDWELTQTGQVTSGENIGRLTKGVALAVKAEALLFCASPLFNGVETGSYIYNADYAQRAAEAAWKVIELADQGLYSLTPWGDEYKKNFFRRDGQRNNITTETVFPHTWRGHSRYFGRGVLPPSHGGSSSGYNGVTQNYVELFEMANGLPIDDPDSGHDLMNPWEDRDPRFRFNIAVDGDRIVTGREEPWAFFQLYIGGNERANNCSRTGFGSKKYWDELFNNTNRGINTSVVFNPPRMRLAEIYLFYAEAANEGYNGPNGKHPAANLTAVDAINEVRNRAGMPGVHSKFLGSKEAFRERVWNERAVELAFENKRWYDLRRWYVLHLPKHTDLYELRFPQDHSWFERVLHHSIPIKERHYWLPLPVAQVSLYPEWKQNPGW